MRDPILENKVSDILLKMIYEYHDTADDWTTSDLQGWVDTKSYEIIKIINGLKKDGT
jgi:hypothetical protein